MRRVLLTTVALIASATVTAVAADLPRAMPAKAPAYVPVAAYNWTGFYVGINGGYAWGSSRWGGFAGNADPSGGMVGGTVGYNRHLGGWVLGLEGDIDWANFSDSAACAGLNCQTKTNWFGTARGRIGYAFDRFMPYFTGGAAFGDIEARRTGFVGASDTNVGWTLGAGIEGAIADRWTAKVEYLYADLGDISCSAAACGVATTVDHRLNVLRAGLNYRF